MKKLTTLLAAIVLTLTFSQNVFALSITSGIYDENTDIFTETQYYTEDDAWGGNSTSLMFRFNLEEHTYIPSLLSTSFLEYNEVTYFYPNQDLSSKVETDSITELLFADLYFSFTGMTSLLTEVGVIGSYNGYTDSISMYLGTDSETAPVPEPATMFLLGSGLVGFAGFRRRKLFGKK